MNGEGSEGRGNAAALQEAKAYMWGYLPGALPQRSPLLTPVLVRVPASIGSAGYSWKDVCDGGCGFAMAISGALSLQFVILFSFIFGLGMNPKKKKNLCRFAFAISFPFNGRKTLLS